MKMLLMALAVLFIMATVLPFLRSDAWWIRIFDFPRAQIAVAGILITAAYVVFWDTTRVVEDVVLGLLVICVGYQAVMMFPYTRFAPKQVVAADASPAAAGGSGADTGHTAAEAGNDADAGHAAEAPNDAATRHAPAGSAARLSLLIANVLMTNREADAFLELVEEYDPDVVLTVETDDWWADRLSVLDDEYRYVVKEPLPNTYGMILQSRLELIDPQVRHILDDSIPSIHAGVRLPNGVDIMLHCLHPRPPYPKEDTDTEERDAELLIVGREVKEHGQRAIVAGDMNDVAWSRTTSLFQKVSGLLDPRVGRGMYNSFNAKNVLLRWPLDHIFHSEHFKLVDLQRLPAWGSDHFPIYAHLEYSPTAEAEQEPPHADAEDEEEATEKIEKANEPE